MALIKRTELPGLLKSMEQAEEDDTKKIFLFFGERFLCREAADTLQESLLARPGGGAVNAIDGDHEDSSRTLGQLMNYSLLPGLQIYRVTDSRLFHSKNVASAIWSKVEQAKDANKETACRRQLFSFFALAGLGTDDHLAEMSSEQWQGLFGFARPGGNLAWADELLATATVAKKGRTAADIAGRYVEAFKKGVPPDTILLLTAEAVDKRKQLFSFIKKEGVVVDCSVAAGASAAAQKGQKEVLREMVMKSLAAFQKKMAPQALELLFERVGFHPVAVVMETEKLALYIGDRDLITVEDLNAMVGRTREDALFELTDAFGKHQAARTLILLHRLLEQGMHGLAILATMRNYLRKMLIFRSLQLGSEPSWQSGMNAGHFQKMYLPALKERGEWSDMLKGHPYALFMSFSKAQEFSCTVLKKWLALLLQAEFRLKGSPVPPELVLEELFLTMLKAHSKKN
jgi:DNA polymerase III subunit delta